jgi:hypothetical protein
VSNFSSVLPNLLTHGVEHVLVFTSDEHACRAFVVAQIVLRSHAIAVSCRRLPALRERKSAEASWRVLRDAARSIAIVLLGIDLTAPLLECVHPDRMRASREWALEARRGRGRSMLELPPHTER